MNKILIIGQAPPLKKQTIPYDSTMLYDWLLEIGITKEQAQDIFEFEALTDVFPGINKNGGHKKPSWDMFIEHWVCTLKEKAENCKSIICLGNASKEYILLIKIGKPTIFLIHPSKRNISLFRKNKESILNALKTAIL